MPVDYDLVIVGGSAVARYAAAQAARLHARVALVEPELPPSSDCYAHSLLRVAKLMRQQQHADLWGLQWVDSKPAMIDWQRSIDWAGAVAETIEAAGVEGQSLNLLAALGVDVVVGQAAFQAQPLGVTAAGRLLRARAYLLAPPTLPRLPDIEGLATVPYLTLEKLWQRPTLPDRLMILGSNPSAVELAQAFNRLGCQVTLVTHQSHLLPAADPETVALLQSHLAAEGVRIHTATPVTQAKHLDGQIWVQAGDRALAADGLLIAAGHTLSLAGLNLETIGVKWHSEGIPVNRKLQTSHPRIYACGDGLGGYSLPQVAQQEARIALNNALFYARAEVDYRSISWAVMTDPPLVQIGLTEPEAQQQLLQQRGSHPVVLRQPYQGLLSAQLEAQTTGLGKLVLRQNGEILGASWLGVEADSAAAAIALAMQHRLKLGQLHALAPLPATGAVILSALLNQWQHRQNQQRRDALETWFSLRRSGSFE